MVQITFIDSNEQQTVVQAEVGSSLMNAATEHGVDGIDASCGGACACATCHCFIDDAWLSMIGEVDSLEDDMLDCTEVERRDGSRLSCQVTVTNDMDGMIVHIPEEQ